MTELRTFFRHLMTLPAVALLAGCGGEDDSAGRAAGEGHRRLAGGHPAAAPTAPEGERLFGAWSSETPGEVETFVEYADDGTLALLAGDTIAGDAAGALMTWEAVREEGDQLVIAVTLEGDSIGIDESWSEERIVTFYGDDRMTVTRQGRDPETFVRSTEAAAAIDLARAQGVFEPRP